MPPTGFVFKKMRHPLKEGTSTDTMSEAPPSYSPKYPYNNASCSESGNQIEVDDTPGAERIAITHRTGSHIEIQPDGTVKIKSNKTRQDVTIGQHEVMVSGDYKITTQGKCTVYSQGGELVLQSDRSISIASEGELKLTGDNVYIKARGAGKITLDAIFVDIGPFMSLPGGITPTLGGGIVPRIVAGGFSPPALDLKGLKAATDAAAGALTPANFKSAIEGVVKTVSQITTQMAMMAAYASGPAAGIVLAKTLLSAAGQKLIPEIDQPEELPLTSPRTYMGAGPDRVAFRDRQFDSPEDVNDSTTYTAHLNICEQLGDFTGTEKDLPGQVFDVDETAPAEEPAPYWAFPLATGTVSCSRGSTTVTGTGTTFTEELSVGQFLKIAEQTVQISGIQDDTTLVLASPWSIGSVQNQTAEVYRFRSFQEYSGVFAYGSTAPLGASGLSLEDMMVNFIAPVVEKVTTTTAAGLAPASTAVNNGGAGAGGSGGNIPIPGSGTVILPVNDAFEIIKRVYASQNWAIDNTTTREQRNQYLEAAVAVLHYGHPIYNPDRADRQWCVKDAGNGRPQSDDVIARQDSRDYWDIVVGMGGAGAYWSLGYDGQLGFEQNIYPPAQDALRRIR